jgi:hypothetical protein
MRSWRDRGRRSGCCEQPGGTGGAIVTAWKKSVSVWSRMYRLRGCSHHRACVEWRAPNPAMGQQFGCRCCCRRLWSSFGYLEVKLAAEHAGNGGARVRPRVPTLLCLGSTRSRLDCCAPPHSFRFHCVLHLNHIRHQGTHETQSPRGQSRLQAYNFWWDSGVLLLPINQLPVSLALPTTSRFPGSRWQP